jgi:hypothetical protein
VDWLGETLLSGEEGRIRQIHRLELESIEAAHFGGVCGISALILMRVLVFNEHLVSDATIRCSTM